MIEHLKNLRLFLFCDYAMSLWTGVTCVSIGFIYVYTLAVWINP